MATWQKIETAPINRARIVGGYRHWLRGWTWSTAYYEPGTRTWKLFGGAWGTATHWYDLPEPQPRKLRAGWSRRKNIT